MSHEWTNPARLRDAAGFEGVEMRDLRHYFAVQNLIRGVPMSVVSVWMGHSSIELTVKRYGRWVAEAREQWNWAALRSRTVDEVSKSLMGPAANGSYDGPFLTLAPKSASRGRRRG